uniref:Murine leukemia virus integrase C-terminal domain-containing protein n=1 Tax=Scophthalmus maximus TaxID=52904 RepID=A0A8D3CG29_SCOMX
MSQKPIDLTQLQELQQNYVQHLFTFLSEYSQQVIDALPSPGQNPLHSFQPGFYVLVRSLKPSQSEPRYGPPNPVLLVTRTAVKVKRQPQWIHASRIKAAPMQLPLSGCDIIMLTLYNYFSGCYHRFQSLC